MALRISREKLRRNSMSGTRKLIYLFVLALFILFFITLGEPLGNERFSDTVFGSYGSTGAAIIFVGMPYILLHISAHHLK